MNIAQKLESTLSFLASMRKGYRYDLTLSVKDSKWTISVTGTCYEDKSLPSDFLVVQTENFDAIPDLIKLKAQDIINKQITINAERAKALAEANVLLQSQVELLKALQQACE